MNELSKQDNIYIRNDWWTVSISLEKEIMVADTICSGIDNFWNIVLVGVIDPIRTVHLFSPVIEC